MARKPGKRNLTEAEKSLWDRAIEKTEPLKTPTRPFVQMLKPTKRRPLPMPADLRSFRVGEISGKPNKINALLPVTDTKPAKTSPNMDKKNYDRLKKGKLQVDGRIDLHGMTLAQAHPALNGFVRAAHASGKRLLLVITGKGNTTYDDNSIMPTRRGVLKQQVPQWLAMAPLAPLILQVTQATQKHGGGGAYYVYLRRQR